jgi:hypothetical protein
MYLLKKNMTVVQNNRFIAGLAASISNLTNRNQSTYPSRGNQVADQSQQQQENQFKFKCASSYARGAVLSPAKRNYYEQKAKDLKLPSAYTAAMMDYLRKGEVTGLDVRSYRGRAGDVIRLKIEKKDFSVNEVKAAIYTMEGKLMESGSVIKKSDTIFEYASKKNIPFHLALVLRVTLCDHIMNMVTQDIQLRA